jgi:hypothetical protein
MDHLHGEEKMKKKLDLNDPKFKKALLDHWLKKMLPKKKK